MGAGVVQGYRCTGVVGVYCTGEVQGSRLRE